ncbi:MAG: cyclic nucleotide-binding domain-containing protein [Deltaproteobacteria bacterium]|nr:cyclic nucleotide-binding domain-containing protein [Deltaproteobacteria bacterium]
MKLTDSQFERIGQLVLSETGVLLRPENRKFIEKRFGRLAKSSGLESVYEIEARLLSSKNKSLKNKIIESVLNFETDFFAGRESFRFLRQVVLPKLMKVRESQKVIRFWSAGCSTGQEPYSLSIMLDEYFPAKSGWRIEILATDLSRRCLKKAQSGIYDANEVEDTVPKKLLHENFEKLDGAWRIKSRHRKRVVFQEHNLLRGWGNIGTFDVVLMRNVLTYVLSPYKRKVAMHTYEHLEDHGFFLLGRLEKPAVGHFFVPVSEPEESCFRKNLDVGQGARLKKLTTSRREMNPVLSATLVKLLSSSDMFQGLNSKILRSIAERFEVHKLRSGHKVVKQGVPNEDFFIIYEGEAKVCVDRGIFKKDLEISRIGVGDIFGITSLVVGQASSANVIADGTLRVFVGSKALFDALAQRDDGFRSHVLNLKDKYAKQTAKARDPEVVVAEPTLDGMVAPTLIPQGLEHLMLSSDLRHTLLERGGKELALGEEEAESFKDGLRRVQLFAEMEFNEIDDYVALSEYWKFPGNSTVVKSGDNGSALYMIASGSAHVVKDGKVVDTIGVGQVFGENSIINVVEDLLDVVTAEPLCVFIVGVELFRYVVDGEVDEDLARTLAQMSGRLRTPS